MSTAKVDSLKPHLLPMGRSTNHVHVVAARFEESHLVAALLTSVQNAKRGNFFSSMTRTVME